MSATIHPMSVPATKSELDLFVIPTTQMVITGNQNQWHLPISDISNQAKRIEFNIPPMQDFLDLSNLFLYVKFKVTKTTSVRDATTGVTTLTTSNIAATDPIYPSPYFLNTMFHSVELYMGSTRITTQNPHYHYKSFFDNVLFSTNEAKDTYLKAGAMWGTDYERRNSIVDGNTVELYGRLHLDICQQDRLIIPAVPLRLIFLLNNDAVNFHTTSDDIPKMSLSDIRLSVRKYMVDDSAKLGIESALQTTEAKYFITRGDIVTRHIPQGVTKHTIDNLLKSVLPRLFIVGLISNEDYSGRLKGSAFTFDNHNVNTIAAYKGGQIINGIPFTPDYANNLYVREYVDLYRALCQDNSEPIMGISFADYKSKCCFYAFNLTPDYTNRGADDGNTNLLETDVIRLEIGFSTQTTKPLNVICYSLYDNHISIDMNREVKIDY